MKRVAASVLALSLACGGAVVADLSDATTDGRDDTDAGDPFATDAGYDVLVGHDAGSYDAGCLPFLTKTCDGGCSDGSVCVKRDNHGPVPLPDPPPPSDLGCVPIPPQCAATPNCPCMGQCACPGCYDDKQYGMVCGSTTVSRRAFKTDIEYVDDAEREQLARRSLSIRLATYRYKSESPDARRRLGFIIDDQPDPSSAVDEDRTHVDLYGYTSMLVATVQEQQRQIDALQKRLDAMEKDASR